MSHGADYCDKCHKDLFLHPSIGGCSCNYKKCSNCFEPKPTSDFYPKSKTYPNAGFQSVCKKCSKEINAAKMYEKRPRFKRRGLTAEMLEIIDYILEFEEDDFHHYDHDVSENHIYYKALKLKHGKWEADRELKEVKSEL